MSSSFRLEECSVQSINSIDSFAADDCDFENGLCEFANGGLGGVGKEWSRVKAADAWQEFQAVLPAWDHTTRTQLGHYSLADLRSVNPSTLFPDIKLSSNTAIRSAMLNCTI